MNQPKTFLGMDRYGGGMYGDFPYVYTPQYPQSRDLPIAKWWNTYIKVMYIIARTIQVNDVQTLRAVHTFFVTLFKLIPNSAARQYLVDFWQMKPYILDILKSTSPQLFITYPSLERYLKNNLQEFQDLSMKNMDGQSLLLFVYLVNVLFKGIMPEVDINLPTLSDIRAQYQPDKITKYEWGNAIWFVLHTSSLYAPEPIAESFVLFKNMLYSLQFLLPCPKCRIHLSQNLQYINMDTCPVNREELFKCTWQLHNIVNQSDDKPQIGLQEAYSIYT